MTINEFIAHNRLTMSAAWTDHNPTMDNSDHMDHWRCIIRCGKQRMSLVFSMGSGYGGKRPELADVLDCLASDAAGYENAKNFADWCADYGYDEDSRRAERTFKAVERQAISLHRVLGQNVYQMLLWDIERL